MKNRLAAFFMQKRRCRVWDIHVEKTKKIAKKFVRYQEGAEQFTFYRLPKALIASNEFPTEILLI